VTTFTGPWATSRFLVQIIGSVDQRNTTSPLECFNTDGSHQIRREVGFSLSNGFSF